MFFVLVALLFLLPCSTLHLWWTISFGKKTANAADGGTAAASGGDGVAAIRPEHRPLPPAFR